MIKEYMNLLIVEGKMTIKTRLRYKIKILSDVFIFSLTFLFVLNSANENSFQELYGISENASKFLIMIGFIFWQFGSLSLGFSTSMISSDASTGMLELKVQGKYSIIFLSFYKMFLGFLSDLFIVIILMIIYTLFTPISMREIGYVFLSFLISIPTIIGMYGIGLLISSLTIKEKNVSSLVLIIQTLLIFVTNVISPIANNFLFIVPYSGGIEVMRTLFISNVFDYGLLGIYILINICWLLIGICVFKKALLHERRYGSFDTY